MTDSEGGGVTDSSYQGPNERTSIVHPQWRDAYSSQSLGRNDNDMYKEPFKNKCMRHFNFVVGCLCIGFGYHINAFNVYANAVKDIFDYTQSQLETIIAMGFLGLITTWPGGVIYERIGPRKTAVFGFLSVIAFFLMWSATLDPDYYHDHFYLFALYMLLASCGGGFMYVVATSVNLGNYDQPKHGLVNGVLQGCSSAGPGVIILLYNLFFLDGYVTEPAKQNLSGFFLMMAILFAVVNTFAVIFYGSYPDEALEKERERFTRMCSVTSINFTDHEGTNFDTEVKQYMGRVGDKNRPKGQSLIRTRYLSGLSLIADLNYHFVAWPMIILGALEGAYITNVTTFLWSFKLMDYSAVVPLINPIFGTIFKPLTGLVSDKLIRYVPRTAYIFAIAVLCTIFYLFAIFYMDNLGYFISTMLIVDLGCYFVMTLSPLLLIELYGIRNFPGNFGITMMGYCITVVVLVEMLGIFYGLAIPERLSAVATYCYGLDCYTVYLIIAVVLSFISAILTVPLLMAAIKGRTSRFMKL